MIEYIKEQNAYLKFQNAELQKQLDKYKDQEKYKQMWEEYKELYRLKQGDVDIFTMLDLEQKYNIGDDK